MTLQMQRYIFVSAVMLLLFLAAVFITPLILIGALLTAFAAFAIHVLDDSKEPHYEPCGFLYLNEGGYNLDEVPKFSETRPSGAGPLNMTFSWPIYEKHVK